MMWSNLATRRQLDELCEDLAATINRAARAEVQRNQLARWLIGHGMAGVVAHECGLDLVRQVRRTMRPAPATGAVDD